MGRKKRGSFGFYGNFSYYIPGVSGMFALLGFLLIGAFIGNLVSLPFISFGGASGAEYATLVSYPIMFIPAMLYASSRSHRMSLSENGLKLDSDNFGSLGAARCVALVVLGTLALSFCCDALTSCLPQMPEQLQQLFESMTQGNFILNFISVSIFAPFFEEWLCRGMVLRGLLGKGIRPLWSIVISAAFFAFIHLNPWQAVPAFILGCFFGYVYYKTGSLKLTMLMHFTNNTFSLVMANVDSLKEMDSWMDVMSGAEYWTVFAACILLLVLIVRGLRKVAVEKRETGNISAVSPIFIED